MASVLFSTVGQVAGGPLGAAIGAVVGGSVDAVLFGSRRQGANDIFVQRSAYGDVLPRIYGRTRTAGQLIWARQMDGMGGKGQGRRDVGASFAIALSSGPIAGVGRIWADGREIRSAEGKFELPTIMRVHDGRQGQTVDPLIWSVEGEERTPDYRGLAYIVFENISLAPFGNRIPNLSFEVFADDDGPADWLADFLSTTHIAVDGQQAGREAVGYAALASGVEEVAWLSRFSDLNLRFHEGAARYEGSAPVVEIEWNDLLGPSFHEPELRQLDKPVAVALTYLDPERDYQAGRQRVERGRLGRKIESEAPLCATAGDALTMAGRLLRESEANANVVRFALPWRWLGLSVGDLVTIGGRGPWRIKEREVHDASLYCEAERVTDTLMRPPVEADPGRALVSPAIPVGPTDVRLFETAVPVAGSDPALFVWLGGGAGWRGAAAELLQAGEGRAIGSVVDTQPFGSLIAPLAPGPFTHWDEKNRLLLTVDERLPAFESRSGMDVLNGANILLVGDELIQYRDAEVIADGVVELSGLLRGCYGTDRLVRSLPAGSIARRILPDQLLRVEVSADEIGRDFTILASGRGDPPGGVEAVAELQGVGLGPMAPVHLQAGRMPDGTVWARWLARDAKFWPWSTEDVGQNNWLWKFNASDGATVAMPTSDPVVSVTLSEQVAMSGAAFGSGIISVEAVGYGRAEFRTAKIFMD